MQRLKIKSQQLALFLILAGLTFPLGILTTSLVKTKITVLMIEQLFFVNPHVCISDK